MFPYVSAEQEKERSDSEAKIPAKESRCTSRRKQHLFTYCMWFSISLADRKREREREEEEIDKECGKEIQGDSNIVSQTDPGSVVNRRVS